MKKVFAWISISALSMAIPQYPVFAQEEDTQLWVYAIARTDISDRTSVTLDASARWREQQRGDEQQTLRATVLHEVTDGVRLGGGGGVFETEGGLTEVRVHQEMDLRRGRLSARTRVEQRFFDGADRMELRLRQLVRYTQPLGKRVRLSVDGEYLGLARTRERGGNRPRNQGRDQWRARSILSADISDTVTLGAAYMLVVTPRKGAPDRINHVLQAYLTMRF
jgi:hypothetical protein